MKKLDGQEGGSTSIMQHMEDSKQQRERLEREYSEKPEIFGR
jgi:hypothetical protein